MVTRSELESMDLSALQTLANQAGQAHGALTTHAATHQGISRSLPESWRGAVADGAAGDLDDHAARMRSNAEGAKQLQNAFANAHSNLTSSRSALLGAVSRAESNGFRVNDDWSLQDVSGKSGLRREAGIRDVRDDISGKLNAFNQAGQTANQGIAAAKGGLSPTGTSERMAFGPGGPAKDDNEPDIPPGCETLKQALDDATTAEADLIAEANRGPMTRAQAIIWEGKKKTARDNFKTAKDAYDACVKGQTKPKPKNDDKGGGDAGSGASPKTFEEQQAAVQRAILDEDGNLPGTPFKSTISRDLSAEEINAMRQRIVDELGEPTRVITKADGSTVEVWDLSGKGSVTFRQDSNLGGPALEVYGVDGIPGVKFHVPKK